MTSLNIYTLSVSRNRCFGRSMSSIVFLLCFSFGTFFSSDFNQSRNYNSKFLLDFSGLAVAIENDVVRLCAVTSSCRERERIEKKGKHIFKSLSYCHWSWYISSTIDMWSFISMHKALLNIFYSFKCTVKQKYSVTFFNTVFQSDTLPLTCTRSHFAWKYLKWSQRTRPKHLLSDTVWTLPSDFKLMTN